jgi:hypothetical protein
LKYEAVPGYVTRVSKHLHPTAFEHTLSGLKFGVRGIVTFWNRCSCLFAGTGGLNLAGLGFVIVSECGAMGATPRKNGRSDAAIASSKNPTAAFEIRSVEYSPG